PGLLPDLPPEAQPPSSSAPWVTYVEAPATREPPTGATAIIDAPPSSTDAAPLPKPDVAPHASPTATGGADRPTRPAVGSMAPINPARAEMSPGAPPADALADE